MILDLKQKLNNNPPIIDFFFLLLNSANSQIVWHS